MTLALVYLALITLAELLTATIGSGTDYVRVGLSLHSLILVVLILQGATTRQTQTRRLLLTLALAPIGFGLGLMEFLILGSRPLIESLSWETFLFPAFVLMVFTGFLEEVIFRGLVQDVSTTLMGRFGIWYGAVLFAVLHIGYLSL